MVGVGGVGGERWVGLVGGLGGGMSELGGVLCVKEGVGQRGKVGEWVGA